MHLLGTAALERFTGYTGQSRSQHATHTWNVTRLPEIDYGGSLADDRTADREVLDALLRVADNSFATHDDPAHVQRLLAERAEHEAMLAVAPRDRRAELQRAQQELRTARIEQESARSGGDRAQDRLDRIGPLSLLRRHRRAEKHAGLETIERFQSDVSRAAARVTTAENNLDQITEQVTEADAWHAEHDWRKVRLAAIERELSDAGHIDLRRIDLDLRTAGAAP